MTRTIYYTATTLDGYLADANDSLDWLFVQDIDTEGPMNYDEFFADIGALTMGRTTFDWVHRHLAESGESWPYGDQPTYVFTHTELPPVHGADIRAVGGDVAPVHAELVRAASGQDIWVVGGGDLAAQFAEAGLLDELMIQIAPVTLGAGRPLFPRPFDLELTELVQNRAFACARYAVVGPRR